MISIALVRYMSFLENILIRSSISIALARDVWAFVKIIDKIIDKISV